jgi:hypothetical protein
MELFVERTIAFILTNLSFSRRLTAWFGSEEGQKKLPGKASSVWFRSTLGAECCENLASWSRLNDKGSFYFCATSRSAQQTGLLRPSKN